MNKIIASILAIFFVLGAINMVAALSVDVTNSTGKDIYYLYASPDSSSDWEEDVLGDDVLLAGGTITINLRGYEECVWDFMAKFLDDSAATLHDVNICDYNVEFYAEGSSADSGQEDEYKLTVDVSNHTEYDIMSLYVSPDTSDEWEEDVLGYQILRSGETITVTLTGYNECDWDFLAKFENGESTELKDVDICEYDVYFGKRYF